MIEVKGLKELEESLSGLNKNLGSANMQRTFTDIGLSVQNSIEESFEDEKSPFGGPWKGLKKSTKRQKRRRNKSSKKLRRSGALADSWETDASSSGVEVGSNVKSKNGYPYGFVHNFGSKDGKIRARRFLPVDDAGNLESSLQDEIMQQIEEDLFKDF